MTVEEERLDMKSMVQSCRKSLADWLVWVAVKYVTPREEVEKIPDVESPPTVPKPSDIKVGWFPEGTIISYKCAYCYEDRVMRVKNYFEEPPTLCSRTCRNRMNQRNKARRGRNLPCPHPEKAAHSTPEKAHEALTEVRRKNIDYRWTKVYACKCGKWHLGRWKYEVLKEAGR